jgi:Mlc titration factor MtfA (ptsG expression regulator)|tara:strand:- start:567 stop:1403 length:837 start_codon:yes stop_codon:yes gene_type:complete
MILLVQADENISWMAPYAYSIVLLGFFFFLFRIFENWYASANSKPLFRHYFIFRKLSISQLEILNNEFGFYKKLSEKNKKQFQHRIATFNSEKKFIGRDGLVVTERMQVLIAAVGCMLSFGRKNYEYSLVEFILIYPEEFYSRINDTYHKGEFNPRERALVFSWKDFEDGYKIADDNFNLGVHEFMHAMQLESMRSKDADASRFSKEFQGILLQLTNVELKEKLDETHYFRAYAFTNQYEFMAVLAEYFIESPKDFKIHFPKLYDHTRKLLNFEFAGY